MKVLIYYKYQPFVYIEYTPGVPISKRMLRRLRRKAQNKDSINEV